MAAKSNTVSFQMPVKFEARVPDFTPLGSLKSLNFDALAKGNHKIEIGFMEGSCCKNLVRAVIKAGQVTGIEVEGCKPSGKKETASLQEITAKAHKAVYGRSKPAAFKPFPVANLGSAEIAGLIMTGGGCILVCCEWFCFICCIWPPHCGSVTIATGPLSDL